MNSTPQPAPAFSDTDTTAVSGWNFTLKHNGKSHTIFKRENSKDAPYYIVLWHGGKRHKKSLGTNAQRAASDRAKAFIDSVVTGSWDELATRRKSASTVGDVIEIYMAHSTVAPRTAHNYALALAQIIRTVYPDTKDTDTTPLTDLNSGVVARFQRAFVDRYSAQTTPDVNDQRNAREKALRSSRSLVQQARSIFKDSMQKHYADAGVTIPKGVLDFHRAKPEGRMVKTEYHAPDDAVIAKAFSDIERFAGSDVNVYLGFWLAVGAGLRRGEIQNLCWEHFIFRDGRPWISGGIGKDHEKIEVPIQGKAWVKIQPFQKQDGFVLSERGLEWAKRINFWMRSMNWNTEKKMHELRAYIGSLLYRVSPLQAMRFMRHKSIRITETFYCRYGKDDAPIDVL